MIDLNLMQHRTIVHMDLDCFFVSVSRLLNPKLNGMPVIVGGGERGVIAACSYETRKFGVHSAMPIKTALRLCPDAKVIRGDYDEYSKKSDEVTQIIREQVPLYERSSIDEFYIDLTGMDRFFGCYSHATELRQKIIHETGLPISMGMSTNKTVSKVATDEVKPNNQAQVAAGDERTFLAPLSIKKIPMIGDKTYHLLRSMGIELVSTLQQMPAELLQNVLGENGGSIWRKANGIDNSPVQPYSEQKSMSTEETFDSDTMDVSMLKNILIAMTEKLCFRMRSDSKLTGCVTVKIRYSNFDTHIMQCRIPYTSSDHTILHRMKELFEKLYNRRMLIRLIGVKFSHLVSGNHQIDMFEDSEHIINLYQAMDKMRLLYGENKIHRAAAASFPLRSFNPFNGISSSPTEGVLSKSEFEYLLVLSPPSNVWNEVVKIKKDFSSQYCFPKAEKLKPHITLANFRIEEDREELIIDAINELCLNQPPFEVRLRNYNFFPYHTLYINVEKKSFIIDFVKTLKKKLSLPGSRARFSFNPHLTIARGLTQEIFLKAKQHYEGKEFEASFIINSIVLLKRKDQYDRCLTIKEFEFHN
jgi:DNA polymerase-4